MYGLPKAVFKKLLLLQVCLLGAIFLALFAFSRGLLSPRALGIAMVALFIIFFFSLGLLRKNLAQKSAKTVTPFDDDTRRRISRGIWMRKVLIGVLALLLVVGIGNGVGHRAYFPTLAGGVMNLLWMYITAQQIKRLRGRIDNQSQVP
jgi:hypothetical protein